ncbi:DnaD domain-containing protein [Cytobacillus firmus]|uniref:DnaD domain-containing protein n=1 Tax=Cytobacillus firmus TaxID=1399 RepID=UPI001CFE8804|nr:DnaD domain protein [Cytobacillus firmus]
MAKFRMVHTEFWDDPKVVEEMTPEDKYFFLYLLTNSNTTQIGIYQITKKQMSFDTGHSIETINALLERFVKYHQNIVYNPETREIAIKNWGKYNFNRGGKPVLDCVNSELKSVKDLSLIPIVGRHIEKPEIKKIYESYYDTPTIRGQEKEKEKEEEKEKQQEKEEAPASAVSPSKFFEENGFGVIGGYIAEKIIQWCEDLSDELVVEAMKIAVESGAKNWRYVEKILINWSNQKIKTVEEANALGLAFKESQSKQYTYKNGKGPVRTEQLPDWFDESEVRTVQKVTENPDLANKKRDLQEKLKKLRGEGNGET